MAIRGKMCSYHVKQAMPERIQGWARWPREVAQQGETEARCWGHRPGASPKETWKV